MRRAADGHARTAARRAITPPVHDFAKDLLIALMIGAEVFVVASLWPLSEWAVSAPRRTGFVVALAAIGACVVLCALGYVPPAVRPGTWRWAFGQVLGWSPLPLFMALPAAVCVASGQSLARAPRARDGAVRRCPGGGGGADGDAGGRLRARRRLPLIPAQRAAATATRSACALDAG